MFVKKGDKVVVIAGKSKGKTGQVLRTIAAKNRVVVQGVNTVKKHKKASKQDPNGGIKDIEAPINASNVMIVDPSTDKPSRVGFKMEKGKKVRYSKATNKALN